MLKWICAAAMVVGLYYYIVNLGGYRSEDAALAIAGFAGLYGLFMLGFFLRN